MATVLNRSTKELLDSVHTPDYDTPEWLINPDLSAVEGVPNKYWSIHGDDVTEMTPEEKAAVDAADLEPYKQAKVDQIDARTAELILEGFEFDGNFFSMSEAAQRNWAGMGTVLALGMLSFPMQISTKDEGSYVLQSQEHCLQFLGTYMMYQAHPNYPLTQGRILKAQVTAATTKAEVDAVEDTR